MKVINNILFNNIIKLGFFFFPFFLVSGPFLADLFVSLFIIFFFILKKEINYKKTLSQFFLPFLIFFYFYININSLLSDFIIISFQSSFPYFRFIIFSIMLCFFLNYIDDLKKIIIYSFVIIYLILFIDASFQIIFGFNTIGLPLSETDRVSSFFGTKLVMGSFVARTFPIIIALTYLENISYKKIVQISIIGISGYLIFISAERVSFVFYLIITCFYIFLNFKKKNFVLLILGFSMFIFLLISVKPSAYKRLILSTIEQSKQTSSIFLHSYRHELHYLTAYNIFKDRLFFGHGIKSFRYLCNQSKYVPSNKIELDNRVFASHDGQLIFYTSAEGYPFFKIIKVSNDNVDQILSNKRIVGPNLVYYKKNLDHVKKNEAILSDYEFKDGCNTHPHNIHMQFISELGLLGYSFLIFFSFFIFINIIKIILKYFRTRNLQNKDLCLFFLLLNALNSINPFLPSGNFFNNWLSVIFYFNIGILIFSFTIKQSK
jgi:O-antigen ligase